MNDAKRKNIFIGVLALTLAAVGYVGFSRSADDGTGIVLGERVKGSEDAAIEIVEFSDFQCPACRAYYPIVKRLVDEYPNDIRVVYKHFPLRRIHPNAELAARAAEAAGMQGKFWEMHDKLFEEQDKWKDASEARKVFVEYASSLGLDTEKFEKDITSREVREKVQRDVAEGKKIGVGYTPYFVVNGNRIDNPRGYEAFKQLVDSLLEEAAAAPDATASSSVKIQIDNGTE